MKRKKLMRKDKLLNLLKIQKNIRMDAHNNTTWGFELPFNKFLMYMKLYFTPQSYGIRIQNRIIKENGWNSIPSTLNRGDSIDKDGKYNEIKISYLTPNDFYNLIQIRLYQNIDYYYLMFVDSEYNPIYVTLTESQMKELVNKYGTAAHGTKNSILENKNIEYRITIPYNKKIWKELITNGTR
jgi:hypothetical protein